MGLLKKICAWVRRPPADTSPSFGDRLADKVTVIVGSWGFIAVQSFLLASWVFVNAYFVIWAWDPYPFILLNLFLSFQAAYTGPIIMKSQNRQAQIDRETMLKDYQLSEEALEHIEKIATILTAYEKDREKQYKLLRSILEEVEDDHA